MAGKKPKAEIITFKADDSLLKAVRSLHNRSEFIRDAILAALEGLCPVCKGRGVLTPNQQNHWKHLAVDHSVEECRKCRELRIVCSRRKPKRGTRAAKST